MTETNLEILAKNLKKHRIDFLSFNSKEECFTHLQTSLKKDMHISWGGSMTLHEIGILNYLRAEKFPHLSDRDNPQLTYDEKIAIERKAFFSDVFLTSANAITEDGLIVNVDGHGNRVAATIFGPKKVYFVVGKNKLVKDYVSAVHRIKTVAAPMNARRLNLTTPCVKTGTCHDCLAKDRICCYTVAIRRDLTLDRMCVLFVNENLGF